MYDLICVGNISIDLYFGGKNLTKNKDRYNLAIGGKYYTDFFHDDIGGGGVNVAAGVAKLGLRPALFGKIGDNPFKEMILKKLTDKKVSTAFCQVEPDYYKISAILITESGERTVIHHETPNHLLRNFFMHRELKEAKNIYFSPLESLDLAEKKKMISYLKGDRTLTFVNLSALDCKRPIRELTAFFEGLDVLIINSHEYAELIRKPYEKIDFRKMEIDLPYLRKRVLIVTDSVKGSYGYFKGRRFFQGAVKPKKIVDTTGCGDAYTAGFISRYIKSGNIQLSMFSGARYAAEKLGRIGAN